MLLWVFIVGVHFCQCSFSGWSDPNDWEEDVPSGWYGHRDPGTHSSITPGTPGNANVGGPMGYNDSRGITPSTPRSMMEPGGGNSWGSFSHKNKVKLVKVEPVGADESTCLCVYTESIFLL